MRKRKQINHNDKYVVLFEFDESDELAAVDDGDTEGSDD